MNETEKQIFKNQRTILRFLAFGFKDLKTDEILKQGLMARIEEINFILNPTKQAEAYEKSI